MSEHICGKCGATMERVPQVYMEPFYRCVPCLERRQRKEKELRQTMRVLEARDELHEIVKKIIAEDQGNDKD